MKLTLKADQRFILGSTIPDKGDFQTLLIYKEVKERIALDSKDMENFGFTPIGNSITWNKEKVEKDKGIEYKFTPAEVEAIADIFRKMSEEKELQMIHLDLYKSFVN
jgi:hypothetical protein